MMFLIYPAKIGKMYDTLIWLMTFYYCLNYVLSLSQHEVEICRVEQPFVIRPTSSDPSLPYLMPESPPMAMETETQADDGSEPSTSNAGPDTSDSSTLNNTVEITNELTSDPNRPPERQDFSLAKTGGYSILNSMLLSHAASEVGQDSFI